MKDVSNALEVWEKSPREVGKTGAVITGGDFQALSALRTFARKGIPVIILDSDHCISRFSRFKNKLFKSQHPADTESYLTFLIDLARRENIHGWVILPNSDEAVYVLSKHKEILEEFYKIPTPCWETAQYVYDKKKTSKIAEKHDIPITTTYYPGNLERLMALNLRFPVVTIWIK